MVLQTCENDSFSTVETENDLRSRAEMVPWNGARTKVIHVPRASRLGLNHAGPDQAVDSAAARAAREEAGAGQEVTEGDRGFADQGAG